MPARVSWLFSCTALPTASAELLASVEAPPTVSIPLPRAFALPRLRVPALSVTPPAKALLPESDNCPTPFLISRPVPLTTPARPRALALSTFRAAFSCTALARFAVALLDSVLAPLTVSPPVPSARSLPTVRLPAFRLVPPL